MYKFAAVAVAASALLLAPLVLSAPGAPAKGAPPPDEEPPLEFTLEIDGKSVPIALGQPAAVEVNGKRVQAKLTARPDRLFKGPGISFRYPRQHAFSVERDDSSTTWTFDGDDNTLILGKIPKTPPAEVVREAREFFTSRFGKENVRVGRTTSLRLAGKAIEGTQLTLTIGGEKQVMNIYAFATDDATFLLQVQDTPGDDGATSRETRQAVELLEKTFRFE